MRRTSSVIAAAACCILLMSTGIESAASGPVKDATGKAVQPDSPNVAAGEAEARKLLLLMDADKNGKISRAEFMQFMSAEFDRLDVNKDGELDVSELKKSQLMAVRHGGVHR